MKPRNQRRVLRRDHGFGADEARNDAAAIDVADHHHRHSGGMRKSHIGDVVGPQIDFRGAAGAFDQHDVGLAPQPLDNCRARPAADRVFMC